MECTILIELRDNAGELRAKARSRNVQGAGWRVFYYPENSPEHPVLDCPDLRVENGASSVVEYLQAMVKSRDKTGDTAPFEG